MKIVGAIIFYLILQKLIYNLTFVKLYLPDVLMFSTKF